MLTFVPASWPPDPSRSEDRPLAQLKRYAPEDELRRWREGLDQALRRSTRRRWRRAVKWLAILTVLSIVAVAGGAAYFYRDVQSKVQRQKLDLTPVVEGVMNILVIGSDSREVLSADERKRQRFSRAQGQRADTIILVQAVLSEKRVVLVHFPRDLWVGIPGHGKAKINSAYAFGPQSVIDTVAQLSGVPVNHYVEVNFNGFRRLVDAIDGIDVCLDRPLRDPIVELRLPAGPSHLDGEDALSFVRSRQNAEGDFGRIKRQQQFLRSVAAKVGSRSILLNPLRVRELAGVFGRSVTVDTELRVLDAVRIASGVRSFSPEQMETYTVPGNVGRANGQSIVQVDTAPADRLFSALRDVKDPKIALAPAPVQLAVADATGRGIGTQVAEQLKARGFVVTGTELAAKTQSGTVVVTPRSQANDARRVLEVVPGARLSLSTGVTEITLIVGSSFRGLAQPPKGAAPQPGGPCASWSPGAS